MRNIVAIFFFGITSLATGLQGYTKALEVGEINAEINENLLNERQFLESQIESLKDQYNHYKEKATRLQAMSNRLKDQGLNEAAEIKREDALEYERMANDRKIEISKLEKQIQDIDYQLQKMGKKS